MMRDIHMFDVSGFAQFSFRFFSLLPVFFFSGHFRTFDQCPECTIVSWGLLLGHQVFSPPNEDDALKSSVAIHCLNKFLLKLILYSIHDQAKTS